MNAIAQQLTTVITIFTSDWFNTGNRVLDSSMVAIVVGALTLYGNYLRENWPRFWNRWAYWRYNMKEHPCELHRAPYFIQDRLTPELETKLNANATILLPGYYYDRVNNPLHKKGYSINCEQYSEYIEQYIKESNRVPVKNSAGDIYDSKYLSNRSSVAKGLGRAMYALAVTEAGDIMYYHTTRHLISLSHTALINDSSYLDSIVEKMYLANKVKESTITLQRKIHGICLNEKREFNGTTTLGTISAKKTFDSLFFEQKPALMKLLKKFKEKTLYPPHISMDTKLGILLYGPPGTGKTGTISAIANELGRHIITINFAEIRLCKDLDAILDPGRYPYKDYLFVFDELDCILDALGELKQETGPMNDWGTMLLAAEGEERKQIIEMMRSERQFKPTAPIDMAYLLQKLDGLVSAEDRVIVATTNNPDKINPALLRPGRFDLKLCLGPCSRQMITDILMYYYKGGEKDTDAEADAKLRKQITAAAASLPEYAITPLELINRAMQADGVDALLAELRATLRTPVRRPMSRER